MPVIKERPSGSASKGGRRRRGSEASSIPSSPGTDPDISLWSRRLSLAEKQLKKAGGDIRGKGKWSEIISWFDGTGQHPNPGRNSRSYHRVTSNLIKSNVDALRPQLYFQNPQVKAKNKNPSLAGPMGAILADGTMAAPGTPIATLGGKPVNAAEQTDLIEAVDNYWLGECKVKPTCRRIINDDHVIPYGVGKWEWHIETEEVKEVLDSDLETGEPTKTATRKIIADERPVFRRVKPWQFLWDPELDEFDLGQAKWVAEVHFMSKSEMEEQEFENLDDLGTGYNLAEDAEIEGDEDFDEESFRRYKVYEIHDVERNELRFWVDGSKKWQKVESPNPYGDVEGTIYTLLGFDETLNSAFPLSIPQQIISKVKARNFALSAMVNHIARFNRKYKYLEGSIDQAELEKVELGDDGTLVKVKDMMGGPEPISDATVSVDLYNVEGLLKREVTEEIGVSAYNRGGREPGVETAYEADKIQAGADVKTEEKRDQVREFMRSIVEKLNQLLQLFMTQEKAIEITGERGSKWLVWTPEDIKGQFIMDVDIYSAMPFSILQDRRQAMEMYSLVAQDPYYDPLKVRINVNRRMGWPEDSLRDPATLQVMGLLPQQPGMAQMQQMGAMGMKPEQQMRPVGQDNAQRGSDMLGGMLGGIRGGRRPKVQ